MHKVNDALVAQYRPFVRLLAQHLKRRMPRADRDDLEQAGMVGLIEGASRFSSEAGATFKTFIGHRVRGAMLDSVREGGWVPRSVAKAGREIAQAIRAIEAAEQRPAREVEIAERLGLSLDDYRRALTDTASRHIFSFDEAPNATDVESAYTPPEQAAEEARRTSDLSEAIAALPEREQLIVEATFFGEATLAELATQLRLTESRVCQLRSQAVARLRAKLG